MNTVKTVRNIAFGGVTAAASVALLFLGGVADIAMYVAPLAAGALMIALVYESGRATAVTSYAATCLLSMLLVTSKEVVFLYVFFAGYYGIVKPYFDRIKPHWLSFAVKVLYFNAAMAVAYALLLLVIAPPELVSEFAENGIGYALTLLALGNLIFIIYDVLLRFALVFYVKKLRPKLGLK